MMPVATCYAEFAFDIFRREQFSRYYFIPDSGRVSGEQTHELLGEAGFPMVPTSAQFARRILDYGRHDMAHVLVPPDKMAARQVYAYARWAVTTIYLHPVRLARALFSPNDWQRHSSKSMLSYLGKQFARNLVPRFR